MGFLSNHSHLADQAAGFQPCQIVCLEYETHRLYGEVVQVIVGRQICWVRPLILVMEEPGSGPSEDDLAVSNWYNLQNGPDLLLPLTLFRTTFDTEVMPLLTHIYSVSDQNYETINPKHNLQLSHFIHRVWQAFPEVFQE